MNIMMLSACLSGLDVDVNYQRHNTALATAKLLGLEYYACQGTFEGVPEDSIMVLYKTDHEKLMAYRLAKSFDQRAVFVVEHVAIRNGQLGGTGGLEMATLGSGAGWPLYHGEHDDVDIRLSEQAPAEGDYTWLSSAFNSQCLQFK